MEHRTRKTSACVPLRVADDVAGELQSPGHTPFVSQVGVTQLLNEKAGGIIGKHPGRSIKSSPSFLHLLLSQTVLHDVSHAAAHCTQSVNTASLNNYFLHSYFLCMFCS